MQRVEIEPFDVFLFRDARPFGIAEASGSSNGIFPPPPSAIFGALRTAAFRIYGAELRAGAPPQVPADVAAVWGDSKGFGSATVAGPLLWDSGRGPLCPMPASVMKRKGLSVAEPGALVVAQPRTLARIESSAAIRAVPWVRQPGIFEPAGSYLTRAGMEAFLRGDSPRPADIVHDEQVSSFEGRTGIGISTATGTVRSGALFSMGFRRLMPSTRIAVWLQDVRDFPLPESGLLRIGQDGKGARYMTMPLTQPDWPTARLVTGRNLFVYLATPARFGNGWLPSWIDPTTMKVSHPRFAGTLVSASLDRPQMLGGWDLARNQPRALERTVRAGSMYYLECESVEAAQGAIEALHGRCVSEPSQDEGLPQASPQAGFGLCFTGVWQ